MGNVETHPANQRRRMPPPANPTVFPPDNLKPRRRSYRVPAKKRTQPDVPGFEFVILENHPDGATNYGYYTRAQRQQAMSMIKMGVPYREIARRTGHRCSASTVYWWKHYVGRAYLERIRAPKAQRKLANRLNARDRFHRV